MYFLLLCSVFFGDDVHFCYGCIIFVGLWCFFFFFVVVLVSFRLSSRSFLFYFFLVVSCLFFLCVFCLFGNLLCWIIFNYFGCFIVRFF